jgi:hypothetical protein
LIKYKIFLLENILLIINSKFLFAYKMSITPPSIGNLTTSSKPVYNPHLTSTPNVTYQSNISYLSAPYGAKPTLAGFQRGNGSVSLPSINPVSTASATPLLPGFAQPSQFPHHYANTVSSYQPAISTVSAVSGEPIYGGYQQQQIVSPTVSSSASKETINVASSNGSVKNVSINVPGVGKSVSETLTYTSSSPYTAGPAIATVGAPGANPTAANAPAYVALSSMGNGTGVCTNGGCGPELNYGLAPPTSAPYPAVPGYPGVTPPELLTAMGTFTAPQVNIAPGLVYGVNNNSSMPALLTGPINPPLTIFENNHPNILDGSIPWWSNYVSSSPGAVFHDNNPCTPSSLVVNRGLKGEIICTTIKPNPEGLNAPPIVESFTPTIEHEYNCNCSSCTQVTLTVDDINLSNAPPASSATTVQAGTLIFELTLVPGWTGPPPSPPGPGPYSNNTGVDVIFNRNNRGRPLILRRGQTYILAFKNNVPIPTQTISVRDAALRDSILIFSFNPVGGTESFTLSTSQPGTGTTINPLFNTLVYGVRQGTVEYSLTVPLDFVGYGPYDIIIGYYQLSGTVFSGGPVVIL